VEAVKKTKLEEQIAEVRRTISADGYPMSVGEITNLYKDGELIIRPEFQRFFRWTNLQKSRFIESLLIGLPIPSIFVAQTESGKWELVDGLQRVSTLLQLQGILRDRNGNLSERLVLDETRYLPSLEGKCWNGSERNSFTEAQRLDIKRSKIDIKIIKRESSPEAKFDLFQRLNSYGSSLNAQEIRSAMLVSISSDFFAWLEDLSSFPPFVNCTQLSEKLVDERFDVELVLRFLVLHPIPESTITLASLRDFSQFLDRESMKLASVFPSKHSSLESLSPPTPKHPPQHPQPIPGNRQHQIHRRIHLDLPIPAVGLEAEEADVGRVDGVLVVNPDEAEGFEGGEHFSQWVGCR
jgi:hypothetical protein